MYPPSRWQRLERKLPDERVQVTSSRNSCDGTSVDVPYLWVRIDPALYRRLWTREAHYSPTQFVSTQERDSGYVLCVINFLRWRFVLQDTERRDWLAFLTFWFTPYFWPEFEMAAVLSFFRTQFMVCVQALYRNRKTVSHKFCDTIFAWAVPTNDGCRRSLKFFEASNLSFSSNCYCFYVVISWKCTKLLTSILYFGILALKIRNAVRFHCVAGKFATGCLAHVTWQAMCVRIA